MLFLNSRDKAQIQQFIRQIYSKFKSYFDATNVPHGYLPLDLKPKTPEYLRVRTNIFPENVRNYVYVQNNTSREFNYNNV